MPKFERVEDRIAEDLVQYSYPETEQRYLVLVKGDHVCLPINLDSNILGMRELMHNFIRENDTWVCVKSRNPVEAANAARETWECQSLKE